MGREVGGRGDVHARDKPDSREVSDSGQVAYARHASDIMQVSI